ncbi:MAG TPA: flagellar hook-basal body complex protein FliE [Oscillatoriaceae cyanobacterium]
MLPLPSTSSPIGQLNLPTLPPAVPTPDLSGPSFGNLYDRLLTAGEAGQALPPRPLEVPPVMDADGLLKPGGSAEFPTAVGPDGLLQPGQAAQQASSPSALTPYAQPFTQAVMDASRLQNDANKLANEAATGGDVDLHDVMIAQEKASVAMQYVLQVRNQVVSAYQDVMRMQV